MRVKKDDTYKHELIRTILILLLTIGLLALVFTKTRTLVDPKGADSIHNWVLVEGVPGDGIAARILFDDGAFEVVPEDGSVRVNGKTLKKKTGLSDRAMVKINGRKFAFRVRPYRDDFKVVFNRTFEDAGIEGTGAFAIGGPLKGQELDPTVWRRLKLILSPSQIETVVPESERKTYTGIVAMVVPGKGKWFHGNETRTLKVKSAYAAVKIPGAGAVGTKGRTLNSGGILEIGPTRIRFELSREIRPFLKTDRDPRTGRKATFNTAMDFGWLRISVSDDSHSKAIYGAELVDRDSGKAYALSLSRANEIVGPGALAGPASGFVVPDVLSGEAARSQIAALLNDDAVVDSAKGFLAFRSESEIQSANPVSRSRYQDAVRDGLVPKVEGVMRNWNHALGMTGLAFQWLFAADGKAGSLASGPGWEWAPGENGPWKPVRTAGLAPALRWSDGPTLRVLGDVNVDRLGRVSPGEWWFRAFVTVQNPNSLNTTALRILPFLRYELSVNGKEVCNGAFRFVPDDQAPLLTRSLFKKGKNEIRVHVSYDGSALPAFHRPFFRFNLVDANGKQLLTKEDLAGMRATVTRWSGWQSTPKMGNSWSPVRMNPPWAIENTSTNAPSLWYDEPWQPLKNGDFVRYFKLLMPERLSGKSVRLADLASSGRVRAYFNGASVRAGETLQVKEGGNWLAFEVKSSYCRLTRLASPDGSHRVNEAAIPAYDYRIRNPFGRKGSGQRGRFLEWDNRNEPALVRVDPKSGLPLFRLSIPASGLIVWFPDVDTGSGSIWTLNGNKMLFRHRKGGGIEAVNQSKHSASMLRYPRVTGRVDDPAPMISKRFGFKQLQPWKGGIRGGDEIVWGTDIFRAIQPRHGAVADVWVADEGLALSTSSGDWSATGNGIVRIEKESVGFGLAVNGKIGLLQNGKEVAKGMVPLKEGDLLTFPDGSQWLVTFRSDGVLVETRRRNGNSERWCPAGANSVSTVVGAVVNGIPYGMERTLNGVLKGQDGSAPMDVQLTLDSTLQRVTTEELLFQNDLLKVRDKKRIRSLKARIKPMDSELQTIRDRLPKVAPNSGAMRQLLNRREQLLQKRQSLLEKLDRLEKKQYTAAFLLMDESGAIRAASSVPFADLSNSAGLEQEWKSLGTDFSKSGFVNRCWEMSYPPGSSFKIITALALLETARKDRTVQKIIQFSPYGGGASANLRGAELLNGKIVGIQLRNFKGETFKKGVGLENAFIHSYNTWFAYSALHMSRSVMEYSLASELPKVMLKYGFLADDVRYQDYPLLGMAESLGVNHPYDFLSPLSLDDQIELGIDRSYQQTTRYGSKLNAMPSTFEINAYMVGELAKSAIGQQIVRMTPLQQLMAVSLVGNGGEIIPPRIIEGFRRDGKLKVEMKAPKVFQPDLHSLSVKTVKNAMGEVALTGTAAAVFGNFPYRKNVFCKTGTAETNIRDEDSWLVGFFENPVDGKSWYFACVFPDSGEGSRVAGETVRRVLEQLLIWQKRQLQIKGEK